MRKRCHHYCHNFPSDNSEESFEMPGHIKLVKGAVDPDPTEFLLPSMDMKKSDQNKVSTFLFGVWIMKYMMII